jgi:hypothetical protein
MVESPQKISLFRDVQIVEQRRMIATMKNLEESWFLKTVIMPGRFAEFGMWIQVNTSLCFFCLSVGND